MTMLETFGLTEYPTMAAPWRSANEGEAWVWGDYFATFQTRPPTMSEMVSTIAGKPRRPQAMTYLYAITVFYRRDRNPSACPVMSVGIEQADYDGAAKIALSAGMPVSPEMPRSGKGPMFVGMFTADGHENYGEYVGPMDPDAIRKRLLQVIAVRLKLSGNPTLIGTIDDVFGHPMTGVPARQAKKGCLGVLLLGFCVGGGAAICSARLLI